MITLITARPLPTTPQEWQLTPIRSDHYSNVLAAVSELRDCQHAIYWPASLPVDVPGCYRMLDGASTVHRVAKSHTPVGLVGTKRGSLSPVPVAAGKFASVDVLHGPVCFRPQLAASMFSHGIGLTEGSFSERLSVSVAVAYRRPAYVADSDLNFDVGCQPEHNLVKRS